MKQIINTPREALTYVYLLLFSYILILNVKIVALVKTYAFYEFEILVYAV